MAIKLLLRYAPSALRAAKVMIALAPHAIAIYTLIKQKDNHVLSVNRPVPYRRKKG